MSNENCTSSQAYCESCQYVKEYDEIKFAFSSSNKPTRFKKVIGEWKNEIISILKKINNFPTAGTKKPSLTEIDSLEQIISKRHCNIEDFNEIVQILEAEDKYKVNEKNRLLGSYFSTLEDLINNFKLSSDGCETCNSGCNTSCEIVAQGGGDCGESSCRGGNCLAAAICSCIACQSCYYQNCYESGCNECTAGCEKTQTGK